VGVKVDKGWFSEATDFEAPAKKFYDYFWTTLDHDDRDRPRLDRASFASMLDSWAAET
jgi:hypothetical protein